jgi:hypothetical protein
MNTILRTATLAAALGLALVAPASAEPPKPAQAQPVDLGDITGVAYYRVERNGLRLVATLAQQAEDARPLRFETLLAPGQTVLLSSPGVPGAAPDLVEISRQADTVVVRKARPALTN